MDAVINNLIDAGGLPYNAGGPLYLYSSSYYVWLSSLLEGARCCASAVGFYMGALLIGSMELWARGVNLNSATTAQRATAVG